MTLNEPRKQRRSSLMIELGEMRWLAASKIRSSTSIPLMIVRIAWATIVFANFSVFAPRNLMVVASLFICACAVAAGFFLIVEMTTPFGGLIRASSAPLREALARLGQWVQSRPGGCLISEARNRPGTQRVTG